MNTISAIKIAAKNTVNNACRALFLLLSFAGALSLFSFLFSCNQNSIFYDVENETELKDPLIQGGPTKIVEFNNALYVASARIWKYEGGKWGQLPGQPGGVKVLDLAATTGTTETAGHLYALISTGVNLSDSEYWQGSTTDASSGEISWTPIPGPTGYPKPSAIYGAGDTLFVGAASGDNYAVFSLKDDASEPAVFSGSHRTGMLLGAAKLGGNYYVSLDGQGVFKFDGTKAITNNSPIQGSTGKGNFTGLLVVDDSLLMVSTSGYICKLSETETVIDETNSRSFNFTFTGAIALWKGPIPSEEGEARERRLLLGRKGSNTNYTGYGYYECTIPENIPIPDLAIIDPTITVNNNATYRNSLGKNSVNSIYQAPDSIDTAMPIFASTQKDSLWACRNRVWNRQE